ncbi:hypothetical protein EJB05_11048, partial [Eragrostis curvula]
MHGASGMDAAPANRPRDT